MGSSMTQGMSSQVEVFHIVTEVLKVQVWVQKKQHFISYLASDLKKVQMSTCIVSENQSTQGLSHYITILQRCIMYNFFTKFFTQDKFVSWCEGLFYFPTTHFEGEVPMWFSPFPHFIEHFIFHYCFMGDFWSQFLWPRLSKFILMGGVIIIQ